MNSSPVFCISVSFILIAVAFSHNITHYDGNQLGGIQEELQLLKGTVQTLVTLVNVIVKKVDSNSNSIEALANNVVAYSRNVESVLKKVDSVSSKVASLSSKVENEAYEFKQKTSFNSKAIAAFNEVVLPLTEQCRALPSEICGNCKCRDDRRLPNKYFCDCTHLPPKRDCKQFHKEGHRVDGVYNIHQNNIRIIRIFCDQTTDGGGWVVFQRRADDSVKFYRDWLNYKVGFGDLQHEFWLGNTNLFTLTLQGMYPSGNELRIELTDWNDIQKVATYGSFEVSNENRKFQLSIGGYSGTAGDSMSFHNGMKFSTFDQDHDTWAEGNSAVSFLGGWWYGLGHTANLNGKYYDFGHWETAKGICWRSFHTHEYSLKHVEMKVRRKD